MTMASLKNYFNEEPDFVPEPPMKTADDYTQPPLEDIYEVLRSRGVSPKAAQRTIDMTRKTAGAEAATGVVKGVITGGK